MTTLKTKIRNNTLTIGSWITIGSSENAEIMGQFDFQWLTVDMEHSAMTMRDIQDLVRTVQSMNKPALVRVEENNSNTIKRVMDTGADGVIVPMIKTKEDAQKAVAAVKYPPQGTRGVGLTRAQGYGFKFDDYKEKLANESVVIAIIEHVDAVKNLEDILSVEGIDASMIGPYDLSGSLGYPGETEREEVRSLVRQYVETCQKMNKPAGYHVVPADADLLNQKIEEGFQFMAFSTDAQFLGTNIQNQMFKIRKEERINASAD